ncbi:hypothetical protein GOODEAATRI_018413 [Goodea atripinnis]|uniref:Uncharacterized protein n=1 Tax=Goodea atripinnis TaxID=208336 RepID=A0ABV0PZN8_9TELE
MKTPKRKGRALLIAIRDRDRMRSTRRLLATRDFHKLRRSGMKSMDGCLPHSHLDWENRHVDENALLIASRVESERCSKCVITLLCTIYVCAKRTSCFDSHEHHVNEKKLCSPARKTFADYEKNKRISDSDCDSDVTVIPDTEPLNGSIVGGLSQDLGHASDSISTHMSQGTVFSRTVQLKLRACGQPNNSQCRSQK